MPYLKLALDSVLVERTIDMEVIVVDDCSKDDTVEYMSTVDDPRVRLYRNDANLGATGNWNRALDLATGDLVKLLCADDEVMPDAISSQYKLLVDPNQSGVVLVAGRREVIGPDGRPMLKAHGLAGLSGRVDGTKALRRSILAGTNIFGEPSAVMFRRQVAVEVGGFRDKYKFLPDLDFYARLLEHGDVYAQEEPVARFRVSTGSGSVTMAKTQGGQMRSFIGEMSALSRVPLWAAFFGQGTASANAVVRRLMYRRLARK